MAGLGDNPFDYWRDHKAGVGIDVETEHLINQRVLAGYCLLYLYDCVNMKLQGYTDNLEMHRFYRTIQAKLVRRLRITGQDVPMP